MLDAKKLKMYNYIVNRNHFCIFTEGGIHMLQISMVLLFLGLISLTMTLCEEGIAWWRYRFCRGKASAQVVDKVKYTFDMSRGTVLVMQEDGSFEPVPSTADRSTGQLPFAYWLFQRGKYQYVLQWEGDGKLWKSHYRFLKRTGDWKIGDRIPLSYRPGRPWVYGIRDEGTWRVFLAKCLGNVILIFAGILMMISAV